MVASLSAPAHAAPDRAGATAELEPLRILLVDDQPARLLTYQAILEPLGECLVQARSGREALKRLMEDDYALILLDVNMPDMDGFETAALIHRHPRYEKTPIIFVTAVNLSEMDRLHGYQLGAVDYVMVPVIPEILRSKVEVLVELYRKRRELEALNASLAARNQELQREKARELETLNESLRLANEAWPAATPSCRPRSRSARAPRSACAAWTSARTSSSPRSRTSCATRWRRCRTRSAFAACRAAARRIRCRTPWSASSTSWSG